MSANCPKCSATNKDGVKFCTICGHRLVQPRPACCPNTACAMPLDENDVFCGNCGQLIDGSSVSVPLPTTRKSCTQCIHFRVAVPISTLLKSVGKGASEAITKITEDETRMRDAEAQQKLEFIKIGRKEWGSRPTMSDHCAAGAANDVFEIHELKNRSEDCPDFQLKTVTIPRDCFSCDWREPHGDPFASLNGITDNNFFRAQSDRLDAEIGMELTAIYHSKGNHTRAPMIHDYCRYFSHTDGKAFVALPYPNRHNDCLAHRAKFDSEPLPSTAPTSKSDMRQTATIILSEIVASYRNTKEGGQDTFASTIARHLGSQTDLVLEQLECFIIGMFKGHTQIDPIFASAVQQVSQAVSPGTITKAQDETQLVTLLSYDNNLFTSQGFYWPLAYLVPVDENVVNTCVQTVRECYWFDQLGVEARGRFLTNERLRIKHGMYSREVVTRVERAISDLERVQRRLESEAQKDPRADFASSCIYLAPLSNPDTVNGLANACSQLGTPNYFEYMPFNEEQQRIFSMLMSGEFMLEESVGFLEDCYRSLSEMMNRWPQFGDSPFSTIFDIAHRFVTMMLNRQSRWLRGVNHIDYAFPRQTIGTMAVEQVLPKNEPTLAEVLYPKCASLHTFVHLTSVEMAKRMNNQIP